MRNKKTYALFLGILMGTLRMGSFLMLLISPIITNSLFGSKLDYNVFTFVLDIVFLIGFGFSFIGNKSYNKMNGSDFHLDEALYKKNFSQGILLSLGLWLLFVISPINWFETWSNKGDLVWVSHIKMLDIISFILAVGSLFGVFIIESMKKKSL